MQKTSAILVITCFLLCACSSSRNLGASSNELRAAQLHPFGRYIIDTEKELELISSAVHFGFSFEGKNCQVYASVTGENEHNYFQYTLDGVYQKKVRVEGNLPVPITLAAPEEGRHVVWIYKNTEAQTGPVIIQKIVAKSIVALKLPVRPVIEFIGNSITCGAAADSSEIPCGMGAYHDHHNAYYAYGPRVARALSVNFVMSCVSGIGVYRNWNSDGPAMPEVYEKSNLTASGDDLWDFKKFVPKIVSIALGTNDFSNGDGKRPRLSFDSANFVQHYISFVQLVKSKYPHAIIALLSSPMVNGDNRTRLENCLKAVKQNIETSFPRDKPVALFFFNPMHATGCSGHPNVEEHAILANELIPFFQNLLK